MSTATRVIKNTGYLYAKMGITMFISLYTTRLVLNSLERPTSVSSTLWEELSPC